MVDQTSGAIRGDYRRVSRPILDLPRPYSVETRDEPKGSVLRFAPGVLGFIFLAWLTLPTLLTGGRDRAAPGEPPAAVALPMWQEMPEAAPAFVLDAPMLASSSVASSARQHTKGGREDIIALGAADGPHARIVAYRPGAEAGPPGTFFLETARRAAEAGFAVTRSELPFAVGTRFGPAEAADVSLSAGGEPQSCLAFRLALETADLRISGWLCGGGARRPDRTQLACFIDRLDLAPGTSDMLLRAAFAGKSSACPPARPAATRGRFG